ncbi:hypothetical protein Taro_044762 [Colocasia esculenta]|uniref:Transposase n=1 Tax=Colocasia esculenta TaxID=4460 RepID=A0A843WK36_COLES|nr:hypothetical protein [Colocasia esculenta]
MPTEASDSIGPSPSHLSGDPSPSHISGAPSRSHLSAASFASHSSAVSSLFQPSGLFGGICIFYSSPSARSWGRGTGRRGPTKGVTERRCPDGQQWNVSLVRGFGVGPTSDHFTSRMGVVSKVYCKIWQKDFAKLPVATQELIFRDLQHFNGKPLDDAIASVPAGVDPSDWQTMRELWTTGDERSQMHGRTLHRLEVFKMGRCKDLLDGTESWVDEERRRRYEAMSEMIAPSDVHAESQTTATPEDAFILVMGKDRPGRVRCARSGETLMTWYGSTSTGSSAYSERERQMQEQLKVQEDKLKAQADKMNQMQEHISQLQSVASKVDEMSVLLSQIQASQARTQPVPVPHPVQSESDSETDEAADDYLDHDVPVS